jgi:uncharacterized membrane protein
MPNVGDLDHTVVLVRDLDTAEQQFARLGFRTTPRGYHSAHMGTANATFVLPDRRTYVELLSVRVPTPANAAQRARLARRPGLHGLAFASDDARTAASELASAGLGEGGAVDFARAVELADGPRDARFTVARLREDALPGAWCFLCQHHTRDLVWRPDFLDQPNGARALVEVLGWASDPDAILGPWRQFLGDRVQRRGQSVEIRTGTATITFHPVEALRDRFGDALGPLGWTAVVVASLGVLLLSAKGLGLSRLFGAEARAVAWRGLASGAGFAAAAVAYRASILAAGGPGSFLAVTWALLAAQALQSLVLLAWLTSRDRPVVLAVLRAWRTSLWAGTMGALASAGWFTAFSLAPAASVRTLGLVEMVMALLVSRRLFRERPSGQELVGQALVALAVLLILQAGAG